MRVTKQRDLPAGDVFAFDVEPVEIGTDQETGEAITACVIVHRDDVTPRRREPTGSNQQATEVKRRICGLNAARVYEVDPAGRRTPVPGDYVEQLRQMYEQIGGSQPSNTQYGWVRYST